MNKTVRHLLLFSCALLIVGVFNNCSKVAFSSLAPEGAQSVPSPTPSTSPTPTPSPSPTSTAFGSLCTQTVNGVTTEVNGAHEFFYNMTPISDPNGTATGVQPYPGHVDGNMNLLTAQDLIVNANLDLCSTEIDIPLQSWTLGFPNYTTLTQWFGVCYDATWTAPTTGSYTFVTAVDDAIGIVIDGNFVGINNDGNVSENSGSQFANNTGSNYSPGPVAFTPVTISAGPHTVEIMYYQGWPVMLEAQVYVLPPGTTYTSMTTLSDYFMQLRSPSLGANGEPILNCPH
jgi:PA14 domain